MAILHENNYIISISLFFIHIAGTAFDISVIHCALYTYIELN